MTTVVRVWLALIVLLSLLPAGAAQAHTSAVQGFVTFESGADAEVIRSTISGLEFTTTDGQDWLYGDWRTDLYNGKYPDGLYTSNGNIFAWLGPNQGNGRIDFTLGGATYLSVWVSTAEPLSLTGYYSDGSVAAQAKLDNPNTNTGRLDNLTITAPPGDVMNYAIIRGEANYWLIDDLSTDADGVPTERLPLILVPGVGGSSLANDSDGDERFSEVWPSGIRLAASWKDEFLHPLMLGSDGNTPLKDTTDYTTMRVWNIVDEKEAYAHTLDFLEQRGYRQNQDLFVCPYDWRKDIRGRAVGKTYDTLSQCIERALVTNPGVTQVNILAHSMGGLVTRQYIADPARAAKVDKVITLGTPYFGAPRVAVGILDRVCFINPDWLPCITHPDTVHDLLVTFPGAYQLAPSEAFFDVDPGGYLYRAYDADGRGGIDGFLDSAAAYSLLARGRYDKNDGSTAHAKLARDFHREIDGWKDKGTNGVEVYMFVGDGLGTINVIVERQERIWYKPWEKRPVYEVVSPANGDGTVPVKSADMRNLALGVDFSGNVPTYYFNLEHGALANEDETLLFATDIFAANTAAGNVYYRSSPAADAAVNTAANTAADAAAQYTTVLLPPDAVRSAAAQAAPRTEPQPLTGRFLTVDQSTDVTVRDSSGNVMADFTDETTSPAIPGASYVRVGEMTAVYLPTTDTYQVELSGSSEVPADIRISKIEADETVQTAVYDDVPVVAGATAKLTYDPAAELPGEIAVDADGDGVVDSVAAPTTILEGDEVEDLLGPTTEIQVEGVQGLAGWYVGLTKIVLVADDGEGSGVAAVEYSLDGGRTVLAYTEPFEVDPTYTPQIQARARDRAGNEGENFTIRVIGPATRLYLPGVIKNE